MFPWKVIVQIFVLSAISFRYAQTLQTTIKNAEFWDETEAFGQSNQPAPDLRLPSDVVPSFYRLKLKTNLENSSFTGQVAITLRASRAVKEIILHSKNLSISAEAKLSEQIYERVAMLRLKRDAGSDSTNTTPGLENPSNMTATISTETDAVNATEASMVPQPIDKQVTHSNAKSIKILAIRPSTGDRLVILLATALRSKVDYILELSFSGKIGDSLTGFYKSSYMTKDKESRSLAVTQFEPTSARAAFPCFDEPAFKAKFEISIAHSQDIGVLSNMKVSTTEVIPDTPKYQWTHFERSIEMSTYLVAYVLSDFKALETTYTSKDNITKSIKVWARPELLAKANYALNITPKLLKYYEDVFGVPYALDKLDLIAIPDFASGAMENWGLITFRETTLLFDQVDGVPRDKQNVAIDVAHELAHQWFGNLVTMGWWTDLWLNEGFATYIEYLGVDHIEPEWNIFESFSRDKMDLLRSDALKNTSPVSREVIDATEISQKFDEISYSKGANLIRMLNHTVSEELFHKGLMIYLNNWKYTNAEENNLWQAMSTAIDDGDLPSSGLSIVEFMNSWTRQAGYPVLQVNRNYPTGTVEVEQRLFTSTLNPYQSMIDQLWHIPISYTTMDAPLEQWSTKPRAWLTKRIDVIHTEVNATQALYVNVGAIGYYRVNYDEKNWQLLSAALRSGAVRSPIAKAQLIDDAFNLAKTSHLNYSYALGLTTCVIDGEDSKIVWDLLLNNMAFLKYNLISVPGYEYFLDYMKLILKKQLEVLNYGLDKPKDDNEAFLVENLVSWECYLETPRCLQWARSQFDSWAGQDDLTNNTIPSHLRALVYSTVLKHGGWREFNILWNVYKNSTEPNLQSLIISVLSSSRDEAIIYKLLELSMSELGTQQAAGAWSVSPGAGSHVARTFVWSQTERVLRRFGPDPFVLPAVLGAAFGGVASARELDELKSFALKNKAKLLPISQTLQKLVDTATFRIDWIHKHGRPITQWFEDYVTGKLSPDGSTTEPPLTTLAPPAVNETTTAPTNNTGSPTN